MTFEARIQQLQISSLPSYAKFNTFVEHQVQHVPELLDHVRKQQKELLAVTRALCQVQSSHGVLESAAIFVISVFYEAIHISFEHDLTAQAQKQLKDVFGQSLRRQLMLRAQECAKNIMELLDVESLHNFFQMNAIEKSSPNITDGKLIGVK
jgi:hypothetical protein